MKSAPEKGNLPKKKVLIISVTSIVALLLVFILAMGNTSAWLNAEDSIINLLRIKFFSFAPRIVEVFTPPGTNEPIQPGVTHEKKPWIENDSSTPAFVRVMVFPKIVAADGVTQLEAAINSQITFVGFNSADWIDGKDGYYYYNKILPRELGGVNGQTSELFTDVKLSDTLGKNYNGAELIVTLVSEAIDTKKWNYRNAWWNTETNTGLSAELVAVDAALNALAS